MALGGRIMRWGVCVSVGMVGFELTTVLAAPVTPLFWSLFMVVIM